MKFTYIPFIMIYFGLMLNAQCQFVKVNDEFGISNINEGTDYGNGISFYDINKDGWDDLSIGNGADEPIFLLNNQGTYTTANFNLQINPVGQVIMLLWSDYDNDGDSDLLTTQLYGPLQLWNNDGNYNFTNVSADAGLDQGEYRFRGAAFADYDHDGFLDLYVSKYYALLNNTEVYYQGLLYHNNGDGTFSDVTSASGVLLTTRAIFQPVFFDYNRDGWEDLYLVIDRNVWRNELFRNNGDGTFTNVSSITGGTPAIDAMSFTVDDFDNDSDFDFYIANGWPGNHLYRCKPDTTYENIAAMAGVAVNLICWGSMWLDYDNNTWQDLFVGTTGSFFGSAQNIFFINNQDGTFSNGNVVTGIDGDLAPSFVSAMGDMNNDGYYDYVTNNNEPFVTDFWRNSGGTNHYLSVSLQGTIANRDGIGTLIHCYAGNEHYVRYTHAGENFQGQNSSKEIFGLGTIEMIDSLVVEWNSGTTDRFYSFTPNRHVHIIEGSSGDTIVQIQYEEDLILCEGESLLLTATDSDNYTWNTGSDSSSVVAETHGTYTVSTTNQFGQIFQSSVTILADSFAAPDFSLTPITCAGSANGVIEIITNENFQSLQFNEVSDTSLNFENLSAGIYQINILSNAGCTYEYQVSVEEPEPLVATLNTTPANDEEQGSATCIVSGGTAPYTFIWNLNEPIDSNNITGLSPGAHTLQIIDHLKCTLEIEFTIEFIQSIPEYNLYGIPVFPNPATNYLFVPAQVTTSLWTDTNGRRYSIQAVNNRLDLNALDSGIYGVLFYREDQFISFEKILIIR